MGRIVFYLFTWLPIVVLLAAVTLVGIGIFFKVQKRPCKKIFIGALVAFAVFVVYILALLAIGMFGFGPGLSD